MVYKQLWKKKTSLMISLHLIVFSIVCTDFIVGTKPLVCSYKGEWYFPAFTEKIRSGSLLASDLISIAQSDFRQLKYSFSIWPILDLNPKELDPANSWLPPLSTTEQQKMYYLGSFDLGRDLFSACLVGLQRSLQLSLIAVLIAGLFGVLIGTLSAFQTLRYRKVSWLSFVLFVLSGSIWAVNLIISLDQKSLDSGKLLLVSGFCIALMAIAYHFWHSRPQLSFSMDKISLGYIELMKSIPSLLILLLLVQLFIRPDLWTLAIIIGFIYIPVLARYSRNFSYHTASLPHIDSQITLGSPMLRTFFKHILPPVLVQTAPVLAFGIANIVLLEASLSFLGLGLAADEISLGKIMELARTEPGAWWVVLFPGILVFWLLYSFNALGDLLSGNRESRSMVV